MENAVRMNARFTVAKFAPSPDALKDAADEGFKSVVNMRTENEKQEVTPGEEREHARAAGLTYLHHPVDGEKLSEDVVDRFREKVVDLPGPVLVHCASGKRSGWMVIMHLAAEQGLSGDEAVAKATSLGFEQDASGLERFVRRYLDRHGDQ
ncbi:protein tyrosine phosphatase family protein [Microbaculum marinum]|uniref:Protein tyrosine phosphatase family protein n=1 Tax=Microbaculum marinum TaxID=1764581 RepID=A0AAW9RPA4_9HYPH